ncbi:MAG: glycosyltransferase [Methylobacterium mesophilicum]|nr:glycosyltransferase [Methylobacterium mesophilicum]
MLDSGVNAAGAVRRDAAARRWRAELLAAGTYRKIVVYSGGMQAERGIEVVIAAAQTMPDVLFVMCGGHPGDLGPWFRMMRSKPLHNMRFFGYVPHDVLCELQQAADTLVLSRAAGTRQSITSPLKFFEYLLAGTPIVAAQIDAISRFRSADLAIDWYEPGDPSSLQAALTASFLREPDGRPHGDNVVEGMKFTWENRQRALMRFVGPIIVKTTF